MMMDNYFNSKSTVRKESVFAWYPSLINDSRKDEAKEIYAHLGSRPPKEASYSEAGLLQQYHQSVTPSELIYKPKQTVETALRTPWSPHISVTSEKDNQKTIPEAYVRRVQSAPTSRMIPTTRIILKIPTPTFQRDNEDHTVVKNENVTQQISHVPTPASPPPSPPVNVKEREALNNEAAVAINNANELAIKKSILKQRPKTAQASLQTLQDTNNFKVVSKQRPSSSIGPRQRTEQVLRAKQEEQANINKKVTFSENALKYLQQNHVVQQTPYTSEAALIEKYAAAHDKSRTDIKIVDGNWKDQLINRSKFLQKRPSYYIKSNVEKLKPDPVAPEIHYKASETYFYNTLPAKCMTFVIDPTFISENFSVRKLELQNKPANAVQTGPVKYNRNYAFVY